MEWLPVGNADLHWRPQHAECPFCLVNFTVYGKMEEIEQVKQANTPSYMGDFNTILFLQDSAYFFAKSRLPVDLVDPGLHSNPSKSGGQDKEFQFWSRVPNHLIDMIFEAYRLDFEMFDYSLSRYLRDLGLSDRGFDNDPEPLVA